MECTRRITRRVSEGKVSKKEKILKKKKTDVEIKNHIYFFSYKKGCIDVWKFHNFEFSFCDTFLECKIYKEVYKFHLTKVEHSMI